MLKGCSFKVQFEPHPSYHATGCDVERVIDIKFPLINKQNDMLFVLIYIVLPFLVD
jgi:hypothetical protein